MNNSWEHNISEFVHNLAGLLALGLLMFGLGMVAYGVCWIWKAAFEMVH